MSKAFYISLFNGASWLFSGGMANAIFGILTMIVTARYLGLSDFGFFVLAQTYVMIFGLIVSFQTWQPVAKYASGYLVNESSEDLDKVISLAVVLDVLCTWLLSFIALMVLYSTYETFGWNLEQVVIISIFMISVVSNFSGAFSGFLRASNQYQVIAKGQAYFGLIRLILICIAAWFDLGVVGIAIGWVLAEVYSHLYITHKGLSFFRLAHSRAFKFSFAEFGDKKAFLSFMISNNVDVSIRMVSRQIDVILLGLLVGKEQVGLYKIAVQIASLPLRVTDPIYQVLMPQFARLSESGAIDNARRLVNQTSVYGGILFVFVLIGFVLIGEPVIDLFFGSEYKQAFNIAYVYILALSGAMIGLPFVPFFQAQGKARLCMSIQLAATLIYALALYPLISQWGAVGAAAAYIIYYAAWLTLSIYYFRKFR